MAAQDHEQDDRSGHNISSKSCHRCKQCDAHYYWCHLDDTQKYFFKCMFEDFQDKMVIPMKFVENFKGQISEVVKLEAPDGNIYSVHSIKDLNKIVLGYGWASFASFYELKQGYFLVFRYTGNSHFKVLIFDNASCCEKEVFHVVMNCGPDAQEEGTHLDRSPPSERRSENGGPSNGESRRRCEQCDVHYYWHHLDDTQKYFLRLMVGNFRQEMSIPEKFVYNFRGQISGVINVEAPDGNGYSIEVTKDLNRIVLGSGWAAFADAYELKEHDVLVFRYIGDSHFKTIIFDPSGCEKELFHVAMNRAPKSNVRETGILHDRPVPKETRCRQSESCDDDLGGQRVEQHSLVDDSDDNDDNDSDDNDDNDSDDNYNVSDEDYSDEYDSESVPSQLVESPHKAYNSKKFSGKAKPRKELSESPNSSSCDDVKHEASDEDESDHEPYYSRSAKRLLDTEKREIIGLASIQPNNPAFMTVLQTSNLQSKHNSLIIPFEFAADRLQRKLHDVLLVRPGRAEKWHVRYYQWSTSIGFRAQPWSKFVRDNRLREGDVCIFELIKCARRKKMKKATMAMMAVHVARRRKADGRFVAVG